METIHKCYTAVIVLIVLMGIPHTSLGQRFGSWQIKDGDISYSHVFETSGDSLNIGKSITSYLQTISSIAINGTNGEISGKFNSWRIDRKKYGSWASTPIYFRDGVWSGAFRIRCKDGKYLAEVFSIMVLQIGEQPSEAVGWYMYGLTSDRSDFRANKGVGMLDVAITDLFTVKKSADW